MGIVNSSSARALTGREERRDRPNRRSPLLPAPDHLQGLSKAGRSQAHIVGTVLLVSCLGKILALRVMPRRVEIPSGNTMSLGNVLDLPGSPGDVDHIFRLSYWITSSSPTAVRRPPAAACWVPISPRGGATGLGGCVARARYRCTADRIARSRCGDSVRGVGVRPTVLAITRKHATDRREGSVIVEFIAKLACVSRSQRRSFPFVMVGVRVGSSSASHAKASRGPPPKAGPSRDR
jgi:hypothetical protein